MKLPNGKTGRQGKEECVRLRVTWVSLGGAEMVRNYLERSNGFLSTLKATEVCPLKWALG